MTPDKDIFYKKLLIISGVITAIYIAATCVCGMGFLSKDNEYYAASPLEALGLLAIVIFILSLFRFLLKKFDASKFRRSIEMSRTLIPFIVSTGASSVPYSSFSGICFTLNF